LRELERKPDSVLASKQVWFEGGYLSRMSVAKHLMRFSKYRDRKKTNHNPSDLAPNRGLPSQYLSILLVRSYRTFAPLPIKGWIMRN